jgi:hypothetical protein
VHIDYISPLNEPQWGWAPAASGGTVDQEGSPWTNQEIYDVTRAIDEEFTGRSIITKIFLSEAGSIANLLRGTGHADNQLNGFWNVNSPLSLTTTPVFSNLVSYHSYWSDYGSLLVDERSTLSSEAGALNPVPERWQTEYSLLGSGYREGYPGSQKLSEMECALSLARIITADLNIANASAWQWWTTFDKGKHAGESRFCLIEAFTSTGRDNGEFHLNKLFYTLGNFSHFIRPDMIRIETTRSDELPLDETYQDVAFSAYTDSAESQLVMVAVNFTSEARAVIFSLAQAAGKKVKNQSLFLTDEFSNLRKQNLDLSSDNLVVPARSVITYTADLENAVTGLRDLEKTDFDVFLTARGEGIVAAFGSGSLYQQVMLYSISGKLIQSKRIEPGQNEVVFPASDLSAGVYLVSGRGDRSVQTKKISIAKR